MNFNQNNGDNHTNTRDNSVPHVTKLNEDIKVITYSKSRVPRPEDEEELASITPASFSVSYNILPGAMNGVHKTNRRGKKRSRR
jgi:hypothetical protein